MTTRGTKVLATLSTAQTSASRRRRAGVQSPVVFEPPDLRPRAVKLREVVTEFGSRSCHERVQQGDPFRGRWLESDVARSNTVARGTRIGVLCGHRGPVFPERCAVISGA